MRQSWSEEKVAAFITRVSRDVCPGFMPTVNQMRGAGDGALSSALGHHGPRTLAGWGERLGLKPQAHCSGVGWEWEGWVAEQAALRGCAVERQARVKAPFDMTISGVRVDVKSANGKWIANGMQWTWRIAKPAHACDVYALVAMSDAPPVVFLVPANVVPLTCTTHRHRRRYEPYRDNWGIFGSGAAF